MGRLKARLAVYALAGLYLLYMAWNILTGLENAGREKPFLILFGILFGLAGAGLALGGILSMHIKGYHSEKKCDILRQNHSQSAGDHVGGEQKMKAYDLQSKQELEVTAEELMKFLDSNRQVDLVFADSRTDEDGYLTWDRENWLLVKEGKYQRNYFLNGKALYDFTHHNKYDLKNSFFPEQAVKIEIN